MISDEIRQKLQNIVRGNVLEGQEDHCTAIRNLLCQSFGSDPTVKKEFESRFIFKEEQARFLKTHADLTDIKEHLSFNGFTHTKRQDYFNTEFRLILEDMHDENVIARNEVLLFIDTVFYIMESK